MGTLKIIFIIVIIAACSTNAANGVDKYTDGNRPYEFGFTIDGEQHRHEKKDENGIIMGEYGFITADGVYHVTVYATDENGHFKILSMKNIRVKPYPTAPTQNSRTGHSLSLEDKKVPSLKPGESPHQAAPQPSTSLTVPNQNKNQPISNQNKQNKPATLQIAKLPASPVKSCSHCSLPATTTVVPKLTDTILQVNQENKITPNIYENQDNGYQNSYQENGENITPNKDSSTKLVNREHDNSQVLSTDLESKTPKQYQGQQNNVNQLNNRQLYGSVANNNDGPYTQQSGEGQSYIQNYNNGMSSQTLNNREASISGQNYPQDFNTVMNIQKITPQQQQSPIKTYDTQNQGLNVPNTRSGQALGSINQDSSQAPQDYPQEESSALNQPFKSTSGDRNPKSYDPTLVLGPQNKLGGTNINTLDGSKLSNKKTPQLISAQMQIVDKNTDIYHKNPGESDGLPEGVTNDYMMRVLYVFNYTVGFHGHYEKGFSDGSKQGYYYVTGRNGVRTRVDYEADEKGFRPKITQEVLDLLSDDVPKPDTEKEPVYGLKSYEFKWLYFPVESKQQR